MTVHRLSHTQVEKIVTGITNGKTFPAEVLQQILTKTDGVPLFVEEMTKAILESGQLKALDGHYELTGSLSTLTIPATLQDSLMARLDRLVPSARITPPVVPATACQIWRSIWPWCRSIGEVEAADSALQSRPSSRGAKRWYWENHAA